MTEGGGKGREGRVVVLVGGSCSMFGDRLGMLWDSFGITYITMMEYGWSHGLQHSIKTRAEQRVSLHLTTANNTRSLCAWFIESAK